MQGVGAFFVDGARLGLSSLLAFVRTHVSVRVCMYVRVCVCACACDRYQKEDYTIAAPFGGGQLAAFEAITKRFIADGAPDEVNIRQASGEQAERQRSLRQGTRQGSAFLKIIIIITGRKHLIFIPVFQYI